MIGEKVGLHPAGGDDRKEAWLQVMYIDPDVPDEAITGWILKNDTDQGSGDEEDRNPFYNRNLGGGGNRNFGGGGNRNFGNIGGYNPNTDW
jgi:hypothetical protein